MNILKQFAHFGFPFAALTAVTNLSAAPLPANTTVAYQVIDHAHDDRVVYSYAEHRVFRSASTVKLLIALDYLETKGPNATIPPADLALLEPMLRWSDNASASTLWVRGGSDQIITRMRTKLSLVDTYAPADPGMWGYTAVSAADLATAWEYILYRAAPSIRDTLLGYLYRPRQCASGCNQFWGIPRACPYPRAAKQGWSGYDNGPKESCVEGSEVTPSDSILKYDPPTGLSTGGSGTLDLNNFVMHSTGTTDSGRIVFAVLTLAAKSRPYDSAAMIITGLTKSLYDNVIFNRQPASILKYPTGHNKNLTIMQSGPVLGYRLANEGAIFSTIFDQLGRTFSAQPRDLRTNQRTINAK